MLLAHLSFDTGQGTFIIAATSSSTGPVSQNDYTNMMFEPDTYYKVATVVKNVTSNARWTLPPAQLVAMFVLLSSLWIWTSAGSKENVKTSWSQNKLLPLKLPILAIDVTSLVIGLVITAKTDHSLQKYLVLPHLLLSIELLTNTTRADKRKNDNVFDMFDNAVTEQENDSENTKTASTYTIAIHLDIWRLIDIHARYSAVDIVELSFVPAGLISQWKRTRTHTQNAW